ncbi:MAG: hypothetical protein AAGF94_05060 [Pseudomonadota bacterium]
MKPFKTGHVVAGLIMLAAGSASAVTITESSFGGDFSDVWSAGSDISVTGTDRIIGAWSGSNDYDFLKLQGLNEGAQSITIIFTADPVQSLNYSYSAGGSVRYSTSPYQYSAWEGIEAGVVDFSYAKTEPQSFIVNLANDFGGTLYIGLYGTHGTASYAINGYLSDVGTSPVALPFSWILLGSGLGALGVLRQFRLRKTA